MCEIVQYDLQVTVTMTVSDSFDKSPNTPIGVSVDGSGTALDVDMDNISDYRDADPFSNRGAQVDENGVELDDDKDGVPNERFRS